MYAACDSYYNSSKWDDFVGTKYDCPHVLADGNWHIWIREKKPQKCCLPNFCTVIENQMQNKKNMSRIYKLYKDTLKTDLNSGQTGRRS